MSNTTRRRVGVQGWRQFLTAKEEMLAAYDQARTQARSHEVETYHGLVAESAFRRWLEEFLPKRYGVTSGYIVSQKLDENDRLPHFDVIIYDDLESPVLWIERNPDRSAQGMARAIPAEHVRAVFEVKSALTSTTTAASVAHLGDLDPLLTAVDAVENRFKRFLPASFFCATIFFELRKDDEYSGVALDQLADVRQRGYFGGLVLRGDGRPREDSALIRLFSCDTELSSTVAKDKESLLSDMPLSNSHPRDDKHIGAILSWSGASFSMFAFDVVALLSGAYNPGSLSSLHGMTYLTSQPPEAGA